MGSRPTADMQEPLPSSRPLPIAASVFALATVVLAVTGCGVITDVKKGASDAKNVASALHGNRATIDAFTKTLRSTPAMPFAATYETSGAHPTTVVYAVDPSKQQLAFSETSSGAEMASIEIVANASGEDACSPGSGTAWSCRKLPPVSAANQNRIFSLYTASHWVTFLRDLSLVAAFAGDKVSSSSMSINGFSLRCVDFIATGVAGTSTICSTQQGILGYLKFAQNDMTFELKRYSPSPAPSLFQLPAGAKFLAQ